VIGWVYGLSFGWLILVVLGLALGVAAVIWVLISVIAVGGRAQVLAALSPGMLPPLGIVFALVVGFLAAGVWSNASDARTAVNREASALRTADLLVAVFPKEDAARMRLLLRRQIESEVDSEWPAMAHRRLTLTVIPPLLGGALRLALELRPNSAGQTVAQRELVGTLENALDARRQRIGISQSRVNRAKWAGIAMLAVITLFAVAFVHAGRPATMALALTVFASAVAAAVILIVSQDRPFGGPFGVKPTLLEQVAPRAVG
jgi:hypothetical protein